MRRVYGVLAIAGLAIPMWHFARFVSDFGFDPVAFITQPFVNPASSMFAWDLVISSLVFTAFVLTQSVRHRWIYIGLTFAVGLSFSLPMFLLARDHALRLQSGPVHQT
jgi:hypothetical protein